jgi:hypothetical protein
LRDDATMPPPVPPLHDDIRWRRLTRTGLKCASCGQLHKGLFDLAADAPAHWRGPPEPEPNSALGDRTHALTHDFCIIEGEATFVRCVLRLPIVGAENEFFAYGVWSSLSAKNFRLYHDTFDSNEQGELGPWFGWFSSSLKGYPETVGLKCKVHPQSDRKRPFIELEPSEHLLSVEQREGVTLDRLLEIFALNGHDLR